MLDPQQIHKNTQKKINFWTLEWNDILTPKKHYMIVNLTHKINKYIYSSFNNISRKKTFQIRKKKYKKGVFKNFGFKSLKLKIIYLLNVFMKYATN